MARKFSPFGLLVAATTAVAVGLPSAASAAVPANSWGCVASSLRMTLFTSTPVEPLIANQPQLPCAPQTEGIDNLGPQVGNVIGVDAVRARTQVDNTLPVESETPEADATVVNVRVTNTGSPLLSLPGTISSQASVTCVAGTPKFSSSYSAVPIKIGGQTQATLLT